MRLSREEIEHYLDVVSKMEHDDQYEVAALHRLLCDLVDRVKRLEEQVGLGR